MEQNSVQIWRDAFSQIQSPLWIKSDMFSHFGSIPYFIVLNSSVEINHPIIFRWIKTVLVIWNSTNDFGHIALDEIVFETLFTIPQFYLFLRKPLLVDEVRKAHFCSPIVRFIADCLFLALKKRNVDFVNNKRLIKFPTSQYCFYLSQFFITNHEIMPNQQKNWLDFYTSFNLQRKTDNTDFTPSNKKWILFTYPVSYIHEFLV